MEIEKTLVQWRKPEKMMGRDKTGKGCEKPDRVGFSGGAWAVR